jgi:hypothetical protein
MTKVPADLQVELAMLWRTLSLIETIDGLSVVDFYEKYTPLLKGMPQLSLSTYWEEISNLLAKDNAEITSTKKSLVGVRKIDAVLGSAESNRPPDFTVMNLPELDYLKHDDRIDAKHDPLNVVQNIYGAAAFIVYDASPYNRSILLSACMALAVKSGRASLMLHLIALLSQLSPGSNEEEIYLSVDLDPLKDVWEHVLASAAETPSCAGGDAAVAGAICSSTITAEVDTCEADIQNPLLANSTAVAKRGTGSADGKPATKNGIVLSFGKADHGTRTHPPLVAPIHEITCLVL